MDCILIIGLNQCLEFLFNCGSSVSRGSRQKKLRRKKVLIIELFKFSRTKNGFKVHQFDLIMRPFIRLEPWFFLMNSALFKLQFAIFCQFQSFKIALKGETFFCFILICILLFEKGVAKDGRVGLEWECVSWWPSQESLLSSQKPFLWPFAKLLGLWDLRSMVCA